MSAPTGDLAFGTSMLGEAHVDVTPKPAGSVLARLGTATTAVFDACSRQGSAGPWAAWARGTVFIMIPAQIVTAGRRIVYRLLAWNPCQHIIFRLLDAFQT
jgi:hypothetical protein